MNLIQLLDSDGNQLGLYNISETDCPDEYLETAFEEAMTTEDPDEFLMDNHGIERVYVRGEINISY